MNGVLAAGEVVVVAVAVAAAAVGGEECLVKIPYRLDLHFLSHSSGEKINIYKAFHKRSTFLSLPDSSDQNMKNP